MQNKMLHMATFLLLVAGGLNWLLVGLMGFDLVAYIASMIGIPMLAKIIYIAVGASAVYELMMHKSTCKVCAGGGA